MCIGGWYFYFKDSPSRSNNRTFNAVPQDAALIITIKNWKKTEEHLTKTEYATTLSNLGLIRTFIDS